MQPMSQGGKSPLYVSETRIIAEIVVIITAAFVLGSVSIVHGAIKQLIKAMRYWIWIAKIQIAIQYFIHGFVYTCGKVLLLSWLFMT